ncbi:MULTISPECIES: hypothetical protein [Streptosporangium]|uniref:Uncharacterized protein n=1 Tax=Streptosporangium sandarakinum TaxID=1260955 RepID=A0A852UV76_9ACTN|nr:hypothetical protein [Streptosporangium sandarakinum]NYF39143.1 hypothetical protein [Streptosporangium sandarakinum]
MPDPLSGIGRTKRTSREQPRNQEWLLALLPAFPLLLLTMRLWYASRQDTQTLLLLVQNVSPLGLLTAVLLTTVWILPALVLSGRMLGALYWISTRGWTGADRSSWLLRAAERLPGWVVVLAVVVGLVSWELRFLPTLEMLALATAGLTVRDRFPGRRTLRVAVCYVLPAVAAVLVYAALWPAIGQAVAARDVTTSILLLLPPGIAGLLTGPVPRVLARLLTHGLAVVVAVFTPFLVGVVVMKAPILPLTAFQMTADGERDAPRVLVGYLVTSDDQMVTVLGRDGQVNFVRGDRLESKVLCPDPDEAPVTWVNLHGWYVEKNVLSWLAPAPLQTPADPRCQGRSAD